MRITTRVAQSLIVKLSKLAVHIETLRPVVSFLVNQTGIAHPLECEKRHSRTSRARFELFALNYETILDGTNVAMILHLNRCKIDVARVLCKIVE